MWDSPVTQHCITSIHAGAQHSHCHHRHEPVGFASMSVTTAL